MCGLLDIPSVGGAREAETRLDHTQVRALEQIERIGVPPAGIRRGEHLPAAAQTGGAANGVREGVRHPIGVRLSPQSASVWNLHAASNMLPAFSLVEPMHA